MAEYFMRLALPAGSSGLTATGNAEVSGLPARDRYFPLMDFKAGWQNPTTIGSAATGAGAGKVSFKQFTVTRTVDSQSPRLWRNMAAGAHYGTAHVVVRRTPAEPPYLAYTFGTVFTTDITLDAGGDEGPAEILTFVYGAMQFSVLGQGTDGRLRPVETGTWDQIRNVAQYTPESPLLP